MPLLGVAALVIGLAGCGSPDETSEPEDGGIFAGQPSDEALTDAPTEPPANDAANDATTEAPTDAPAEVPPPEVQVCELVTDEEAEVLAATPLDAPVPSAESCRWTGPVTGPLAQVEIYVGDGAKKIFDIDQTLEHEFVPVAGIGDEAHAEDGAIFFSVSGRWVAIRLVGLGDSAAARLEALARAVADRM